MNKKKRPVPTYKEQAEVLKRPWIDTKGIMILLPIGETAAVRVRQEIEKEMEESGEFYFKDTRPRLIPTRKVVEKFKLDPKVIYREARREM